MELFIYLTTKGPVLRNPDLRGVDEIEKWLPCQDMAGVDPITAVCQQTCLGLHLRLGPTHSTQIIIKPYN